MNILRRARRLEAGIARTLERAAERWARTGSREPLEIAHAIIEAIAERLEPGPRGRHVFPFNRIRVSVAAGSREARARLAAVFESEPTLQTRIAARLRDAGCDPGALRLSVMYVAEAGPEWTVPEFRIDCDRLPPAQIPVPPLRPVPLLTLTIASGTAARPQYEFALPRVNLGRCAEVRDGRTRLVRTNHVVFTDQGDAATATVSRCHAHIEYEEGSQHYRIVDDRSAHGTSVVRLGTTIPVPAGTRGVRLRSDDEIVLGGVRVRVRLSVAEGLQVAEPDRMTCEGAS